MQDKMFQLSLHELTACVYYKLAIERGLRGCYPDSEAEEHKTTADHRFEVPSTPSSEKDRKEGEFGCAEAKESDISHAIK